MPEPRLLSNKEINFLKKIINFIHFANIEADAAIGEPDFRIVKDYDLDRYVLSWDNVDHCTCPKNTNIIKIPSPSGLQVLNYDMALITHAVEVFSIIADQITLRHSPVIGRINSMIYTGLQFGSDLKYKGRELTNKLKDAYFIARSAWDDYCGTPICNHGLLSYNRIYRGEYAVCAEELLEIYYKD